MATSLSLTEVAALKAEISSAKKTSMNSVRRLLTLMRETQRKDAQLVSTHGDAFLKSSAIKSVPDEERFLIYEQVAIAACECGDVEVADRCVSRLESRFPGSIRAGRLRGMVEEASGDIDGARATYAKLLQEHPSSQMVLKRMVAIERTAGDLQSAIKALNHFLNHYMADADGWAELADLYLEAGMHKQAAFCLEELILIQPHTFCHHLRLGETLLSYATNLEEKLVAYKHLCTACELCAGAHPRVLWSLLACVSSMASKKAGASSSGRGGATAAMEEIDVNVARLASKQLKKLYAKADPDLAATAQAAVLDMLGDIPDCLDD